VTAARIPDGFAPELTARRRRKWERIIAAFLEGRLDELQTIHRGGARGRIFSHLIETMLKTLGVAARKEPIFAHVDPDPWHVAFASSHGLRLRTYPYYNPDFILDDGDWLEVTVSENDAYKKLFIYGHQAPGLTVVWLDADSGLHREICRGVDFPNARIVNVEEFYGRLAERPGGSELIEKFILLKQLKGSVL